MFVQKTFGQEVMPSSLIRAVPRHEFCEPLIEFAALQNIATFQPDGSHTAGRISCEWDAMPNERPTGLLAGFSKPFSERDQTASFSRWRRFPRLRAFPAGNFGGK